MKLRHLFESNHQHAAIIFGRFNPPHFGHKAAWEVASKFPIWYVGTNQSTQGPKDPLPFDIKIEAMKTFMPSLEGHLVAEQSWFTLAAMVYKKYGGITLHIVTDNVDAQTYLPMLQKQNGVEGPHGFYHFKDILLAESERQSEASKVRKAVKDNNPQDFETYSGVSPNTIVAGHPYFKLVRHYMLPYMQAEEEKERLKAEKERIKAEKEAAKAAKHNKVAAEDAAGVGIITKQNSTADVNSSTPKKNLKAFNLIKEANKVLREMRAKDFIKEGNGGTKKMSPDQKSSMKDAVTVPGLNMSTGSAYKNYRMGIALAGAPDYPTKMAADNWIGGDPLISSYTKEEFDMVKAAAKLVGAGTIQNWTGDRSKETADTNKSSPVNKRKPNKYGI
jgi:hypothetical protein